MLTLAAFPRGLAYSPQMPPLSVPERTASPNNKLTFSPGATSLIEGVYWESPGVFTSIQVILRGIAGV